MWPGAVINSIAAPTGCKTPVTRGSKGVTDVKHTGVRQVKKMLVSATALAVAIGMSANASWAAEDYKPKMSKGAKKVEFKSDAFKADPTYDDKPYDPKAQLEIYGGKKAVDPPRPLFELGRKQYLPGQYESGSTIFGELNPTNFALQAFGDWRTAVAFNDNGNGNDRGVIATQLNIDVDMKITATERIHAFFRPLDDNGKFTSCQVAGRASNGDCELNVDINPENIYLEGDFAAILAGMTGEYYKTDRPFTIGFTPLFFQNGLWMNDAIWGGAFAFPALNSRALDISNMDFTLFAGFDDVNNQGVRDAGGGVADHNANVYGATGFIETRQGYIEGGIGMIDVDKRKLGDQDLYSAGLAWSARYKDIASYSVRGFASYQDRDDGVATTGKGYALLLETSWNTSKPYTVIPYANFFLGIDRPQALASGDGLLKNTGILFESDNLTGFPALDDSAADAYGGAIGIQYLGALDRQIVVEMASIQKYGNDAIVNGNQYGIGVRWQLPIAQAWILRADAMAALRNGDDNIFGARFEVRRKF